MNTNVDNLNFKVILNDDQFNQKIKELESAAKKFNTSMSSLLNLEKASQQWSQKDVENNRKALQAKVDEGRAQEKINREKIKTDGLQRKINAQIEAATQGYKTQSRILQELKGMALGYLSVHGATQLLSSLMRVTGEFELQKTTLAAMLGDLNQAELIVTRIQALAVESPFQFKELTTYAKQLSAFAVPAEELYDTTKMLADVSAGLGVGMDRLVLAYGQVRSAAFLRGQEVRQFTEAGIPILNMLAKQFEELEGQAVSTGEVFDKISKRLVPFEMVAKAFKDMTSEGGKFYNMQEIQAETLKGKISNLKDAYEVMLNEIGQNQSDKLKGVVDWTRKLIANYEETGRILLELVTAYGVYRSALIATEIATKTFDAANHKLIGSLVNIGKYLIKNPYTILAAGVVAAGYAIYRNHKQLEGFQKIQKTVAKTNSDFLKDVSKETTKLDSLYARLKLAKEGTEDYNEAKKDIYSQFSGYISELKAEGVEVDNLAGIYENLKTKIEDATKARTSAKAKQKLTETYDQEIDLIYDRYIDIIMEAQRQLDRQVKNAGGKGYQVFNEFEKAGFWKFITGSMNMGDLERTSGLERVVSVLNNATIDASSDLKTLRAEMVATTQEYNKSLREIKMAYGEVSEGANGITPLSGADGTQEVIDAIQKEISALQTLKREYEEFKDLGISDDTIALQLQGYFPNIKAEHGEEFITQLNYATRILEKVKELERIAPDEAYDIMTSLGLDKASLDKRTLKSQIKAFEDIAAAAGNYLETIRKWTTEDFNLDGEGIALDVSKIASDLNEKINKIELRVDKAKELFGQIDLSSEESIAKVKAIFIKEFGADAWSEFWEAYYTKGESAIQELADAQVEYERKLSQEKLNDLASKYVKEVYFTGNINFDDLGDKTFLQLGNIKEKLQALLDKDPLHIPLDVYSAIDTLGVDINNLIDVDLDEIFSSLEGNGLVIDDTTKSALKLTRQIQKAGLSTDEFGEIIKKVIGGDLKNLTEEQMKSLMEMVESYMSEMKGLLSSIADYAEAIGNDELQGAINGIAQAMDIMGSMADKLSKGDWIGAIVSGITSMASVVLDAATAEAELNRAIAETRNELRLLASQNAINEGVESIFGIDEYKQFTNAYDEAVKAHEQALKDIEKQNQKFLGHSEDNWGVLGVAGSAAAGAGLGAAVGSIFPIIGTAIGAGVGALVGMVTGLIGNAATEANDYALTLKQMADSIGADLINNETGALNSEALKSIKETYTDLDSEYMDMLNELITNAEIFENAITSMATYMTDMFGQCADEMADSFISAFKESGEAALDYSDIIDDVATNIAKSVVKSMILENVFSEEDAKQAAIKLASGDTAGGIATVEQAMEAAKELTPAIQALLESLQPYFQMGEEQGATLGSGIKGITEDTANLLASYLNAIRADVSYSKTIWERMDHTTQQIASMLSSVPSLMEYQAQIAANTFDTAVATQDILSILSEFSGAISSDGGYTGIRTIG